MTNTDTQLQTKQQIDDLLSRITVIPDAEYAQREARIREAEHKHRGTELLIKHGYPERHVLAMFKGLHGKSLAKAKELLESSMQPGTILCVIGQRGVGKTQIATWLAGRRYGLGRPVGRYVKALDLMLEIKASWRRNSQQESEMVIMAKHINLPYLVIDEWQEVALDAPDRVYLTNLLDHRYDAMRPTMILANATADKLPKMLGPSITDRCIETGGVVECNWDSYRKSNNGAYMQELALNDMPN